MTVICMVGPNAIGKTTAVERWSRRYGDRLTLISCDNQRVIIGNRVEKEVGWSGTAHQKQELCDKYLKAPGVTLIESARTDIVRFMRRQGHLFVVVCCGASHGEHMRARCALKKKKEYRVDYWTPEKLSYESKRRYVNSARANFHPAQTSIIEVDRYEQWKRVDKQLDELLQTLGVHALETAK
jgi:hypothetical protein